MPTFARLCYGHPTEPHAVDSASLDEPANTRQLPVNATPIDSD